MRTTQTQRAIEMNALQQAEEAFALLCLRTIRNHRSHSLRNRPFCILHGIKSMQDDPHMQHVSILSGTPPANRKAVLGRGHCKPHVHAVGASWNWPSPCTVPCCTSASEDSDADSLFPHSRPEHECILSVRRALTHTSAPYSTANLAPSPVPA